MRSNFKSLLRIPEDTVNDFRAQPSSCELDGRMIRNNIVRDRLRRHIDPLTRTIPILPFYEHFAKPFDKGTICMSDVSGTANNRTHNVVSDNATPRVWRDRRACL